MPGANCSIYGYSTSRKNSGLAIFRVPTGNDEFSQQWREKIVNIITRDRVIDQNLRKQINAKTLHTCELHYPEDQLIRNQIKTTRIPGALPTLNLPKKTFPNTLETKMERSTVSITKRSVSSSAVSTVCYKSFSEFYIRIHKLKLPVGWEINKHLDDSLSIKFNDEKHIVPKYKILVDNQLSYQILIFNWLLPTNHCLNSNYNSTMKNVTLSTLISSIVELKLCQGVTIFESDTHIKHFIPQQFNPSSLLPLQQTEYFRLYFI